MTIPDNKLQALVRPFESAFMRKMARSNTACADIFVHTADLRVIALAPDIVVQGQSLKELQQKLNADKGCPECCTLLCSHLALPDAASVDDKGTAEERKAEYFGLRHVPRLVQSCPRSRDDRYEYEPLPGLVEAVQRWGEVTATSYITPCRTIDPVGELLVVERRAGPMTVLTYDPKRAQRLLRLRAHRKFSVKHAKSKRNGKTVCPYTAKSTIAPILDAYQDAVRADLSGANIYMGQQYPYGDWGYNNWRLINIAAGITKLHALAARLRRLSDVRKDPRYRKFLPWIGMHRKSMTSTRSGVRTSFFDDWWQSELKAARITPQPKKRKKRKPSASNNDAVREKSKRTQDKAEAPVEGAGAQSGGVDKAA